MAFRKRWVLLEHTGAPNDPEGRHFDLLLEDGNSCRTWRLAQIPLLEGPAIEIIPLPLHKIDWLNKKKAKISGGRGIATRVMSGQYEGQLPKSTEASIRLDLHSKELVGRLEINGQLCKLRSNDA